MFSIEREDACWREVCNNSTCLEFLYCDKNKTNHGLIEILNKSCPFTSPDEINDTNVFNFGIYIDALQSRVVESYDFPKKFFYCFWWGLRNLSALGQNLKTSTFVEEILFAVVICIAGLVLFSLLIGNMQVTA